MRYLLSITWWSDKNIDIEDFPDYICDGVFHTTNYKSEIVSGIHLRNPIIIELVSSRSINFYQNVNITFTKCNRTPQQHNIIGILLNSPSIRYIPFYDLHYIDVKAKLIVSHKTEITRSLVVMIAILWTYLFYKFGRYFRRFFQSGKIISRRTVFREKKFQPQRESTKNLSSSNDVAISQIELSKELEKIPRKFIRRWRLSEYIITNKI